MMKSRILHNRWKKVGLCLGMIVCLYFAFSGVPVQAQTRSFFFDIRSSAYKGLSLFESADYVGAIPLLEQAITGGKQENLPVLKKKLAFAYARSGQAAEAAKLYAGLEAEGVVLDKQEQLMFANALMGNGQLEEGRKRLTAYLFQAGQEQAARKLREMPLAELFRDSIRYSVRPASFNSKGSEFSPVVLNDGILFISDRGSSGFFKRRNLGDGSENPDLFFGKFSGPEVVGNINRLSRNVNSSLPEGPAGLSQSEMKLYFTRSGGEGNMQLFQADKITARSWVNVKPLDIPVDGAIGHPAISADGERIYFVSDKPGGYGGTDIYRIDRIGDGWSEVYNLGPLVNTAGNEMFPTLTASGVLYFSSNGHLGLGGLDIFQLLQAEESIKGIRNMGAPVNSPGDDFGLSFHESGYWGYFSSNRAGGAGKDDIYRLNLHVISLSGRVRDKTNGRGIAGVEVLLEQQGKELNRVMSDEEGNYAFKLYPGEEYLLAFSAEDYRAQQAEVSTQQGKRFGILEHRTELDRKVKMFVLGSIRNSRKAKAGGASLLVIDQSNGRIDSVHADERGNYELELDTKSQYAFLAECEQEKTVAFFSTPEKGKASLSYYVNLELEPAKPYQVKGKVNSPAGKKGPYVVSVTNLLTLSHEMIVTNESGEFSFEAHPLADYELCLMEEGSSTAFLLGSGWEKRERAIQLNW